MKLLLFCLLSFFPLVFAISDKPVFDKETCTCGTKFLGGKVRVVEYGEDFKVQVVKYGEDLKVILRDYTSNKPECGKWTFVDYGEDFKIRMVTYGEDFKIRFVDY